MDAHRMSIKIVVEFSIRGNNIDDSLSIGDMSY